jgi:hypothetical protein
MQVGDVRKEWGALRAKTRETAADYKLTKIWWKGKSNGVIVDHYCKLYTESLH